MKFNPKLLIAIIPTLIVGTVLAFTLAGNNINLSAYDNEKYPGGGLNNTAIANSGNTAAGVTVVGGTGATNNGANGNNSSSSGYVGTTGATTAGPTGSTIIGSGNTNTQGNNTDNPPEGGGGSPIQKQDITGISFDDYTLDYDGQSHSLFIDGELPEGVSVVYNGNNKTDVGDYIVTAYFVMTEEATAIYNPLPSLTAHLIIKNIDTISYPFRYMLNERNDAYIISHVTDKAIVHLTIPEYIDGIPVRSIGFDAFKNCTKLTTVLMPSIQDIGRNAFSGCSYLKTVDAPRVRSIQDHAFYGCTKLYSFSFPETLITIEKCAFDRCTSLSTVTLPNSLTKLGGGAFIDCSSLRNVSIPSFIEEVGSNVFGGCNNLDLSLFDNALYLGNNDNRFLLLCSCSDIAIDSVQIHPNCKFIDGGAFNGCTSMTSVTIPNSVIQINGNAFQGCSNLRSIVLSDNLNNIGAACFEGCESLETNAYDNAFYIGSSTNPYCYLLKSTTTLVDSCSIHNSCKFIGYRAMYNCKNLNNISIPSSVIKICEGAFMSCDSLTDISLNTGVKYLADHCFSDCNSLVTLTMPESIEYVGGCFSGCSSLTHVTFSPSMYTLGNGMFFESAIPGLSFEGTKIGYQALESCANLTSVNIYNLVSVDFLAFACSSLEEITLPDSLEYMGIRVFEGCKNLASATLSRCCGIIPEETFNGCSNLTSLIFPKEISYVDRSAFKGCSKLDKVFYTGVSTDWNNLEINDTNNDSLLNTTIYFYSENQPSTSGNYWHYVDDVPTVW